MISHGAILDGLQSRSGVSVEPLVSSARGTLQTAPSHPQLPQRQKSPKEYVSDSYSVSHRPHLLAGVLVALDSNESFSRFGRVEKLLVCIMTMPLPFKRQASAGSAASTTSSSNRLDHTHSSVFGHDGKPCALSVRLVYDNAATLSGLFWNKDGMISPGHPLGLSGPLRDSR